MTDKASAAAEGSAAEKSCYKGKKRPRNADVQERGAIKAVSHTKAVFLHLHFKNLSGKLLNIVLPINMSFCIL